ncbi:ras association domain-containing protein 7 isoform X1 [Sminthopsis crassicaudata]|uniref:ras association domain-containing protein 7 isoform X1 n=1 Tax=Sminthopsis crassicaudata TaxID=9301 RepID=UPI003D69B3A4
MELKVWVDGVQRVVCGVSEQTTCQEVVIALAQALGQTGRYVLIQRLRDKERQMLPQECPVGAQATCGQFASDVQFVLRRTGPSLAERPASDPCLPPGPSLAWASLPPRPQPPARREPHRGRPSPPLGRSSVWPKEDAAGELWGLEHLVHSNEAELGQEGFWQEALKRELEEELERQGHVQTLQAATEECVRRLRELDAQARALEEEIRWQRQQQPEAPGPRRPQDEAAAARLQRDLQTQALQSERLESSLASVGRALAEAEQSLQAQAQEVEELNRELRQCNLQQFIQQAGPALPPRPQGPGSSQVRAWGAGHQGSPRKNTPLPRAPRAHSLFATGSSSLTNKPIPHLPEMSSLSPKAHVSRLPPPLREEDSERGPRVPATLAPSSPPHATAAGRPWLWSAARSAPSALTVASLSETAHLDAEALLKAAAAGPGDPGSGRPAGQRSSQLLSLSTHAALVRDE